MKIVILESNSICHSDLEFDIFDRKDHEVTIYPKTSKSQFKERIKDAEVIIINRLEINKDTIGDAKNLKLILITATGYNNIDIDYCKSRSITVCNAPKYSSDNVSQMVFAYIFQFFYNVKSYADSVFKNKWIEDEDFILHEHRIETLTNKTIGIVGYGDIGKEVEKCAKAFGMNVLINTRSKTSKDGEKFVTLEELLRKSDIVTLHTPLTKETENLIDMEKLSMMKNTAYLINTSRGKVIKEEDLVYALNNDIIKGAALDVIKTEPMEKDCILLKAKNLIITPHVAWAGYETRKRLMGIIKENFDNYIKGTPQNVVNE